MLELDSANEFGDFEEMAKACGPIRYGEAGIVTGNQSSGDNQNKGASSDKNRKPVLSGVIAGRSQNSS